MEVDILDKASSGQLGNCNFLQLQGLLLLFHPNKSSSIFNYSWNVV